MNLTLAILLAQNLGSLEGTDWAVNIITNINHGYFHGTGDVLVYHHYAEEPEDWLMEKILKNLCDRGTSLVTLLNGTEAREPPNFVLPKGIILFMEFSKMTYATITTDFLMNILKALHNDLRVVVIVQHHKFVRDGVVLFMLEKFWTINVRNVIIVNTVLEDTTLIGIKIFYWRPDFEFKKHAGIKLENIKKIALTMEDNKTSTAVVLKSDKLFEIIDLTDIRGHFLNVSVAVTPPYVWLNVMKWGDQGRRSEELDTEKLDGIEISILREFRKKYNLTGFYLIHPSEIIDIDLGDATEDGYSVLEETALGMSDIAIGGNLASVELYAYFGPSSVYFVDDMRWYVPGAKEIPLWRNLYFVFNESIWLMIGVAHVLASIITFIMMRRAPDGKSKIDFSVATLAVWATELSQPVQLPIADRVKLLFTSCLLYGMHISNFYQSGLITVLHEQYYESPIRTMEEAMAAGLGVCVPGISYDFFMSQKLTLKDGSNFSFTVEPDYAECLNQVAENRKMIALVPEKTTEYTIPLQYLDENHMEMIQKMPGRLIRYPVSVYLSKASPYKKQLNFVITGLLEGGMISKWWDEIRFSKRNRRSAERKLSSREYHSISLKNATGVFSVFMLSLGISFVIFLAEVVWHGVSAWRRNRTVRRMVLDGKPRFTQRK